MAFLKNYFCINLNVKIYWNFCRIIKGNNNNMTITLPNIHPTAIVEDGAKVSNSCKIGPYCCIGPEVTLDENVSLESHVVISGKNIYWQRNKNLAFFFCGQ